VLILQAMNFMGASKSTLMLSLLRVVELDSGKISIDGIDIQTLGLTKLRSKIAVIPRDPVLFSGTICTNLDPFYEHLDSELQDALTHVGLFGVNPSASLVSLSSLSQSQVQSLSDDVKESGSNFSVGQRHLLVIALAILCGAAIVCC
jgi:ATP-binding cassette subfamily C (CFTR/MRP) protein 1